MGRRPADARLDLWLAVLLVLVTVAVYWPVHAYDFVNFDDVDYVRGNVAVRAGLTAASIRWAFTTLRGSFWIPLTWLSYMVDTQLYGTDAGGYHVTNVLLHVASTVLLFVFLRRATDRPWPSAVVAALFAIHPLHVESVAWVTERKDTLSTVFLLLTLGAYGAYARRPTAARYLGTLAVFACGLVSKPMLTTMPLLLLLVDLWPLGRLWSVPPRRLMLEKVPFLVLAMPAAFVTMASGHHIDTRTPLQGLPVSARLANVCESYVVYVARTVWPTRLAALYPDHPAPPVWQTALAALVLVGITAGAVRMARRRPYVTAGWLWYVVALLPVSGIVKIGHFTSADRFTYVPLIGLFVVAAWGASELAITRRREAALAIGAGVLLATSAVMARVQLGYWRDGVTLAAHSVAVTGPNPVMQYLLGLALAERGETDEAMARYAESLRLRPGYAHAHTSLALLLQERGQVDDAIAHYTRALEEDPGEAVAHTNLANLLFEQGRKAEAMAHYTAALRAAPDMAETHDSYGRALAAAGRLPDAIAEYETALRLKPDDAEAHNNLANALVARDAISEAVAHYAAALRLRPRYAAAHRNLAILLAEQGNLADAAEHYVAALKIEPDDGRAHSDLGNVLAAEGRLDDAVVQYAEALRLEPGYAGAHTNLGNVLVMLGRADEAIGHYAEALRIDPGFTAAQQGLEVARAARR